MGLNIWNFILDTLEAAGVIGGYVSLSIIGVNLITYAVAWKTIRRKANRTKMESSSHRSVIGTNPWMRGNDCGFINV